MKHADCKSEAPYWVWGRLQLCRIIFLAALLTLVNLALVMEDMYCVATFLPSAHERFAIPQCLLSTVGRLNTPITLMGSRCSDDQHDNQHPLTRPQYCRTERKQHNAEHLSRTYTACLCNQQMQNRHPTVSPYLAAFTISTKVQSPWQGETVDGLSFACVAWTAIHGNSGLPCMG